ncbi:glutamyl-tRNA reductase [Paenibacillus chitinolyticus]|uniref:glutamyl-tRNA reductase n=1 Tax=Paenibacillus chitinolyticus TaxID=79263 RepID=UPI002DBDB111|nr:glutamyl-tRNA reductase [Paenibacillus chitinolyticus]MEC0244990.1 glutamyl-tRNA reductase [Paenibacillus chitinolyticus]
MHIVVVGLNYRTAPVAIREKFTFTQEELSQALVELRQTKSILECVVVATCNRTEIYAVVDRVHICGHYIRKFMEEWFEIPRTEFNNHLYIYEHDRAIEHLFRVASGLDSMIIGETQILGQVKDAFLEAQRLGATGTIFNTLFKQAVTMAKRAHSETSIGENPVSVSYAAVELGKRIFGSYEGKKILIVGAGKMSELTVKHLYASGAERVDVVNRTYERALELAGKFNGHAYPMEQLYERLAEADIVISSTGSSDYVLTKKQLQSVLPKRKSRPLFMMDIAVPRDLDPDISDLPDVFLYDIDDLEAIVDSHLKERKKEAVKIEDMIGAEIAAFDQWTKTLGVSPVIHALQAKANMVHQETMESLFKKLPDLEEREMKVIRKLTKSIVNQMLRDPILAIKEMAAEKKGDEALEMFTKMFALEELMAEQAQAEALEQAKAEAVQTAAQKHAKEELTGGFTMQPALARS